MVNSDSTRSAVIQAFEGTQMKPHEISKRNPRILITRVSSQLRASELKDELLANNPIEPESQDIRPLYTLRYGKGQRGSNPYISWVVEVSPKLHQAIIKNKKVYLDYQSCPARDYVHITRCYKCQAYGHIASVCPKQESTCGRCAQSHDTRSCKEENVKCANCIRLGSNAAHVPGSKECQAHIRAVIKVKSSTDYGDMVSTLSIAQEQRNTSACHTDINVDVAPNSDTQVLAEKMFYDTNANIE